MGLREDFQKRIEKKQQEISDLELSIREAKSYIQALQDSLRFLPKDSPQNRIPALRPGSGVYKARQVILKSGKPMHISEILQAIGLPKDKKHRLSISGTLASYARKDEVFIRTSPNTFGLVELGHNANEISSEPPPDFGLNSDEDGEGEIQTEVAEEVSDGPPETTDADVPF